MKLGRYEYGYWFITIALSALIFPFLKVFPNSPQWTVLTIFTIALLGLNHLYSLWFLHHICENHLSQWISHNGFSYKIDGVVTPGAHIRGVFHDRNIHIELRFESKFQTSSVKCQVENARGEKFKLSKRGFLNPVIYSIETGFDQAFAEDFRVTPKTSIVFMDASLRNRLSQIQSAFNIIELVKFEKNEVTMSYTGLLTDEEKLDGALEVVSLIAEAVQ